MVICCVIDCSSRSGRDDAFVKFYRVPSERVRCEPTMRALSANRRALWLLRICREDLDDVRATKNGARVCSRHFVSGAPSILEDITNPDWAPSLNLGHNFFENERKLRKRKEESIKKSTKKRFCDSYVDFSKYQRSSKKSLEEQIAADNGTLCTSKNACCYMNAEESDDSEDEGSMSSSEIAMPDSPVQSSTVKESPLITDKPEISPSNECITHITVISEDTGSISLQPNYARSILKPKHARCVLEPEHAPSILEPKHVHNTTIQSEDALSVQMLKESDFKTKTDTKSDEVLSTTAKSKVNLFDNLDSEQKKDMHEIFGEFDQTELSKYISEGSCGTYAEAISATEFLLQYMMNQDKVNDDHVNFLLSLAQRLKEKIN